MAGRSLLFVVRVAFVGVLAALAFGVTTASGDSSGAPVSVRGPEALGTPGVGKTLRTTNGTWSTAAAFTYQWLRCSALYVHCTNIPGATNATYVPVLADVGHTLGAVVTATNAAGSTSVQSSGDGLVEAERPGVKHLPWVRGTKKVGKSLFVTGSSWTRSPYQFSQQWLRCSATGDVCHRITGKRKVCFSDRSCLHIDIGTDSTYTLTRKDIGHRIRIRVAASNGAGRSTSTSVPTRIVTR